MAEIVRIRREGFESTTTKMLIQKKPNEKENSKHKSTYGWNGARFTK